MFLGVRGPLTREILGLPPDTTIGDPGLLLPLLVEKPAKPHGGTVCVTHFHENRTPSDIKSQTGVDVVVSAAIGLGLERVKDLVSCIAGASFVLSGALHAAIVAAAYGVPFAYFDSGHVDLPFKWLDFAASVGIPCAFARTIRDGKRLYADEIQARYTPLPLLPLLANAPFHVMPEPYRKAVAHDGMLPRKSDSPPQEPVVTHGLPKDAQAVWLSEAGKKFLDRLPPR